MGSHRREFESALREALGVAGARAMGQGREALYVLLRALGVGEGDRVGITGYTCLSVVEPVLLTGAHPVYLDSGRRKWTHLIAEIGDVGKRWCELDGLGPPLASRAPVFGVRPLG